MTFCPGARGQLSGALMQKLAKGSVTTVAPFALDRAALALRPTTTNETGSGLGLRFQCWSRSPVM